MTSSINLSPSSAAGAGRPPPTVPIALTLVIGLFIVLGHDGCRALQMLALALPLVVWSAWPLRSAWLHRLRTLSSWWLAMGVGAGCG